MMSLLGYLFFHLLSYSLHFVEATHILGIYKNTSTSFRKHTCHFDESSALLDFKNSLHIDGGLLKSSSWRNDTDCCGWDGVTCNPDTGYVVGLDVTCAEFTGAIHSNSSLFLLVHLESLNLSSNDFRSSTISPKIGQLLHLKYLDLSSSSFSGDVPVELSHLRNLISLDLSDNDGLRMPTFKAMIENLTGLEELDLTGVSIDSFFPESVTNLSFLESLRLWGCGLRGKLPSNILALSHLRVLDLRRNDQLDTGNVVELSNWSSPLQVLYLSDTNFSRQLPHSVGSALSNSLRRVDLSNCSIYGPIPKWVWNATEAIDVSMNHLTGNLPLWLNVTRLSTLSLLNAGANSLNGTIPSWLFSLPSISKLDLHSNQFGSIRIVDNVSNSLNRVDLSDNTIYGSFPNSFFHFYNLTFLSLSSNFLSGTVELNMFSNLQKLVSLLLSNNNISIVTNEFNSTSSWPNLYELELSSCNISQFPFSDSTTPQKLGVLDLSKNNIKGEIPVWLKNFEGSGIRLNLSYNHLTGGLENLPWKTMYIVDISYNTLQGLFPVLPPSDLEAFFASNNRLGGLIDLSICNSKLLKVLDLSSNALIGQIPYCLGNSFKFLRMLNLRSNNLSGSMPVSFSSCDYLMDLDLSGNRLEGVVPRSLAQCSKLVVLNLGNNKMNDAFPYWLGTLSMLQVLVLRSNYFHGPVTIRSYSEKLFSMLRILDLSDNHFNGTLSSSFFESMRAMRYMDEGDKEKSSQYLGNLYYNYEFYSVTITVKGTDLEVERILNTLTTIDVSSNMFEGEIPASVGELHVLRWLNFSHNKFSKQIPTSIGSLKVLESLDLSCNHLSGEIPQELGSLTFLEVFNVSENQLIGPIPGTTQLSSLSNSSYLGNPGLCGPPLSKKCPNGANKVPPTSTNQQDATDIDWTSNIHLWEVVLMGYSVGWAVSVIAWYFILSARNPLWLSRFVYLLEYRLLQWLKMRNRGHPPRPTRN